MEPENNIQSGVSEVKPVANEAPKEDIVFSNKPKKKTGMIFGMVLFAILAIGGIGFGVWTWMDGNSQKEALNKQIDDLTTQNSELLEKLGKDDGNTVVDVDIDANSNVDTTEYIYVGEWGLKIKIPDRLKRVSYDFKQRPDSMNGGTVLWVWGNIDERLPDFANPFENDDGNLGAVTRVLASDSIGDGCGDFVGILVFSDDGYNYCYAHPQAVYSIGDEEIGSETESSRLIQEMLNNKENYSKI